MRARRERERERERERREKSRSDIMACSIAFIAASLPSIIFLSLAIPWGPRQPDSPGRHGIKQQRATNKHTTAWGTIAKYKYMERYSCKSKCKCKHKHEDKHEHKDKYVRVQVQQSHMQGQVNNNSNNNNNNNNNNHNKSVGAVRIGPSWASLRGHHSRAG